MSTVATLVGLIQMVLQILIWIIVIQVVLSWLIAFNIINSQSPFVRSMLNGIERLLEPLLRPIRRILPDLGGLDFSPMVLILLLIAIQRLLPAILIDTGLL